MRRSGVILPLMRSIPLRVSRLRSRGSCYRPALSGAAPRAKPRPERSPASPAVSAAPVTSAVGGERRPPRRRRPRRRRARRVPGSPARSGRRSLTGRPVRSPTQAGTPPRLSRHPWAWPRERTAGSSSCRSSLRRFPASSVTVGTVHYDFSLDTNGDGVADRVHPSSLCRRVGTGRFWSTTADAGVSRGAATFRARPASAVPESR